MSESTSASLALLTPIRIGPAIAANRIMFGPHATNLGNGRALSGRHVAYYERRAAGGCAVIVVEEASVHPHDWPYERAPEASQCGPGWNAVASACRSHGALVLAGLGHSGGQGTSHWSQRELWAPSDEPEVITREVPKVMELADIVDVVSGFGAAAKLAIESGCDGVEINAGQHSLLRQFYSGLTNRRNDAYGEDRLLMLREVLAAVRDATAGSVLGLRLCGDELAPWAGITPDDAVGLAQAVAPLVDYLVVVRGSIFSVSATRPDCHEPAGFNLGLVAQIRAGVGGVTPVVAQGSIVDVAQAEQAVLSGQCDLVEMTRAQIADADLAHKAARSLTLIRPCVRCNQMCCVRDNRNPLVSCIGDPCSGHETADPDLEVPAPAVGQPVTASSDLGVVAGPDIDVVAVPELGLAETSHPDLEVPAPAVARPETADPARQLLSVQQRVLVVGGGPAGLEAARTAALRGHQVTLCEQSDRLGGMVPIAAAGSGRVSLSQLTDWLAREVVRYGAEVRLETPVTAADVRAHLRSGKDSAVIIATGSIDGPPTATPQGRTAVGVVKVLEAAARGELDLVVPPAAKVVVIDPIGGSIGLSVAELLTEKGRTVSLVTGDHFAGQMLSLTGDLAPANVRLARAGVEVVARSTARATVPEGVVVQHRFSHQRRTLSADVVIDAGYRLPAALPLDYSHSHTGSSTTLKVAGRDFDSSSGAVGGQAAGGDAVNGDVVGGQAAGSDVVSGRAMGVGAVGGDVVSDIDDGIGVHRDLLPPNVAIVGDAVAPRTIHEAILEARRAVLALDDQVVL